MASKALDCAFYGNKFYDPSPTFEIAKCLWWLRALTNGGSLPPRSFERLSRYKTREFLLADRHGRTRRVVGGSKWVMAQPVERGKHAAFFLARRRGGCLNCGNRP